MASLGKIARRTFMFGGLALAGGVAFGWWKYSTPYGNPLVEGLAEGEVTLNPFVMISPKGVTIVAPRAEMGQGVHTTLAAMVAEEMDLDLSAVTVVHGPASAAYFNAAILAEGVPFQPIDTGWLAETLRDAMGVPAKFLGLQITGGSSSTIDAFDKMRLAGAAARAALVQAAAQRLGVDAKALKTEGGAIVAPDGTRLSYTELAAEAGKVKLSSAVTLKPQSEWKVLGKAQPRVDMMGKVTGTAIYTADLRLPGMRYATARTNPNLEAAMNSYDAAEALAMPGVEKVVPVPGGVAVVANSTWVAMQAAQAITFDWAKASYPADSAAISQVLADSFTAERQDSRNRNDGDVDAVLTGDVFEAAYSVPYLAHATMETQTAAAWLHDGALTIWVGNQIPTQAAIEAAAIAGLPLEKVKIEIQQMGGGFGRRLEMDVIRQIATLVLAMEGAPVLLTWTREEDMTHDAYRPAALARFRGKVAEGGAVAFDLKTCSSGVIQSQVGRLGYSVPGPDSSIVQGAWDQPYGFANYRVTGYRAPPMVPVGSWRSVGSSQNTFFHETAVDELAHLAGVDPITFRLAHLTHEPSRKVLQAVAEMSDWGNVAPNRARGVAFCVSFGVCSAQVIEVEDGPSGLRMTGAWAAVDVGIALDPGIIEAQVMGAMVYGLSAAVRGEITLAEGQVQQATFWDYEPLRMPQMPQIEVRILEDLPHIRGIGEPGTPPAAPALGNAIFALTGKRLRDLPFANSVRFA
ncbi:MAG: molybdopterin cofactor-binding domain-containing protein [Alphaproteobacteria bacterium]